jgi:hypothetical protein
VRRTARGKSRVPYQADDFLGDGCELAGFDDGARAGNRALEGRSDAIGPAVAEHLFHAARDRAPRIPLNRSRQSSQVREAAALEGSLDCLLWPSRNRVPG